MKKQLIGIALISLLITNAAAVEVLDISISPNNPRHGESVDVRAYVDGEGEQINTVDLDVRENDLLIVDDEPMTYVGGDDRDISSWVINDSFTVDSNTSEEFIYDLNVQAIDSKGNQDKGLLTIEVLENETVVDESETTDSETEIPEIFGIKADLIVALAAIFGFMYVIFIE